MDNNNSCTEQFLKLLKCKKGTNMPQKGTK